jgi:outer membrane protein OmpA-like peptidoglycan-associated protein
MVKYFLLILICLPSFAQKGDHHFSLFAGRTDFDIQRQKSQTNYIYNQLGFGYGYGIGNRVTLYATGEKGTLATNKIVLSPALGSLSSALSNYTFGIQTRLFSRKKTSLFFNLGANYQALENTCNCVVGDRYRREYSGLGGLQVDYRLSNKWSIFLSSTINKPISTTLNDPDFYMSNKVTDNSKDRMFKNLIGLTYYIEHKKINDSDKDGVKDEIDRCPNTPKGDVVNADGCSESQLDADQDGIVNVNDKCPSTPTGEKVNKDGCSESQLDDDLDGVNNLKDICKSTLRGQKVNALGCALNQLDTDLDGVFDDVDKCPEEKGDQLTNGCPIVSAKIENQINQIANEVNFITNKADLLVQSMTKLNELLVILLENPDLKIIISGHTDDVGNAESNYVLSEKRASSVLNYLAEKGIARNRMTALAFGEQQLKENLLSDDARAKNRRVEIKIFK